MLEYHDHDDFYRNPHHHHHHQGHHHDHDQMADEEKFERTIAILGRLLRDDLQLQVGETLFLRAEDVDQTNLRWSTEGKMYVISSRKVSSSVQAL